MKRSILLTTIGLFALCLGLKAEVYSGTCDSITWSLDTETGVLAIEGKVTGRETDNLVKRELEQSKTCLQYKEDISAVKNRALTQKATKDGEKVLVLDALPVKVGVYKQKQYKRGDLPVEDFPFEIYKKVFGTDTIDVNDDIKKIQIKAVQMDVYNAKGQNNVMVPCFLITNPQLNVIEVNKNGFTNKWVCDMPSHRTIEYGTVVNEYYTKKFKPSPVYKEIEKVFKTKPSKKNAYLGVWKCKNYAAGTYYKIYGKKYRVGLHIRRNNAQGSIETVEYLKDKTTLEGGNPCAIRWNGPDSYALFYQWNGNVFSEMWERSSMEELGEDFNRVVMGQQQR